MLKLWPLLSPLLACASVHAQAAPRAGQDLVLRDFHFASGEVLPELRIHYIARGHGSHSLPAVWKSYLAEFLQQLP